MSVNYIKFDNKGFDIALKLNNFIKEIVNPYDFDIYEDIALFNIDQSDDIDQSDINDEKNYFELIDLIFKHAVISGGIMPYLCKDMFDNLPKILNEGYRINDIDIYINNIESFQIILNYITENIPNHEFCHNYTAEWAYSDDTQGKDKFINDSSIVNITWMPLGSDKYDNYNPPMLQLIYYDYENPADIFESYDMDYVQCLFDGKQLVMSEWCMNSYNTGYIRYMSRFYQHRIDKAVSKGFKFNISINGDPKIYTTGFYEKCELSVPTRKFTKNKQTIWYDTNVNPTVDHLLIADAYDSYGLFSDDGTSYHPRLNGDTCNIDSGNHFTIVLSIEHTIYSMDLSDNRTINTDEFVLEFTISDVINKNQLIVDDLPMFGIQGVFVDRKIYTKECIERHIGITRKYKCKLIAFLCGTNQECQVWIRVVDMYNTPYKNIFQFNNVLTTSESKEFITDPIHNDSIVKLNENALLDVLKRHWWNKKTKRVN